MEEEIKQLRRDVYELKQLVATKKQRSFFCCYSSDAVLQMPVNSNPQVQEPVNSNHQVQECIIPCPQTHNNTVYNTYNTSQRKKNTRANSVVSIPTFSYSTVPGEYTSAYSRGVSELSLSSGFMGDGDSSFSEKTFVLSDGNSSFSEKNVRFE